jgi:hypothetical protein
MAQAPPHNSKFIPRKKWKKMQHNHVDVEDESLQIANLKIENAQKNVRARGK